MEKPDRSSIDSRLHVNVLNSVRRWVVSSSWVQPSSGRLDAEANHASTMSWASTGSNEKAMSWSQEGATDGPTIGQIITGELESNGPEPTWEGANLLPSFDWKRR
jgi:hypothetical protein